MDHKDFVEKIAIPLLSSLITVVGLILVFRSEARKLRLQRTSELGRNAKSIFARALYCESLSKLLIEYANQPGYAVRLTDFQTSYTKLLDDIFTNPEISTALNRVYGGNDRSQIFLLFAESRAVCMELSAARPMDLSIYFTLLTLLYLLGDDEEGRNSAYETMENTKAKGPKEYEYFLVKRLEKPLAF